MTIIHMYHSAYSPSSMCIRVADPGVLNLQLALLD